MMYELISEIIARVRTDRHPTEIRKITLDRITYQFLLQECMDKMYNISHQGNSFNGKITFLGADVEIKESIDHDVFYIKVN